MKKLFHNLTACLIALCCFQSSSQAQLPTCSNIYYDDYLTYWIPLFGTVLIPLVSQPPTLKLYNFDPAAPVSATNPVLNTISLPSGYAAGLTVSKVLNSNNPTLTFYCITGDPFTPGDAKFCYYDPATSAWVITNHQAFEAVNLAAGGNGLIYGYAVSTSDVYTYDGTGDATLLITIPEMDTEGPADLVADCEGNWYIMNFTGRNSTPFLRKYSPTGVLLGSWTISNPNDYEMITGGGFAIIGNIIYTDVAVPGTRQLGIASATLTPGNIVFNNVTAALPSSVNMTPLPNGYTQNILGDMGSCPQQIPITASISVTADPTALCLGTNVTYTTTITGGGDNPQYQWFVNGVAVPGATNATFTYPTGMNELVTCQLTSSSFCVPERVIMSTPVSVDVVDGSEPALSYPFEKICEQSLQTDPVFSPQNGTFSVIPASGLNVNSTNGKMDITGAAVGDYTITYTTKGNSNCPSKSISVPMKVMPRPQARINISDPFTSLCQGDEIRLETDAYPNTNYYWWPQHYFGDNFFEHAVTGKFPEGISTVSVYVENEYGCVARDTTTINLEACCKFDLPNAFTPNGDGRNDYFAPVSVSELKIIDFSIYNRWGQLVYKGFGSDARWDGKLKSKELAQGIYNYRITFRCGDKEYAKQGDINLIR